MSVRLKVGAALVLSVLPAFPVAAKANHLPLVFFAEGARIRTSACLEVSERRYPATEKWTGFGESADAEEQFVAAVVKAMQTRDKAALVAMTAPQQTKDAKKFDTQAEAFFQQFQRIEIVGFPVAFELGDYLVFHGVFNANGRKVTAPLMFQRNSAGQLKFLPLRTEDVAVQLTVDWFVMNFNAGKQGEFDYCTSQELSRANYRANLSGAAATPQNRPAYLHFRGEAIAAEPKTPARPGTPEKVTAPNSAVAQVWKNIQAETRKPTIAGLASLMNQGGSGRLQAWFSTATKEEQQMYRSSITNQEPFFVIDAGVLQVVYLKTTGGGPVQCAYFVTNTNSAGKGTLLWTNSSHITISDQVYKRGPIYSASLESVPFASLQISK